MQINQISDAEHSRYKQNKTSLQQKNADATKEGVVVNSFVKENTAVDMNDTYNTMIISDDAKMPEKLKENKQSKSSNLLPISLLSTGVMAGIFLVTSLIKRSSKINLNIEPEKQLDHLTRNISITDETIQGVYQMVQCPNRKTILAGSGVIVLTAMAFMGKMFLDGFKDVWVKKREADIQKNLQENLISVETQAFSGKIQIIRSMLADKAREFSEYLCDEEKTPLAFRKFMRAGKTNFAGNTETKTNSNDKQSNFKYFALGAATLGGIVALGFLSLRNLSKGRESLENYIQKTSGKIKTTIEKSSDTSKEIDKRELKKMFLDIDEAPEAIKKWLSKLKWTDKQEKNDFIEDVVFNSKKSTTKADKAIGGNGTPKPAFNSYVSDYRAFFYNYLLDRKNPQFKVLFWAITGLSALGYGGQVMGEAVKDIQVKKMNAQTELELQKRLVATELRNFKSKKDAAINPLTEEFYKQVENGKSKKELKVMADNILFEVKNGPPFVYS